MKKHIILSLAPIALLLSSCCEKRQCWKCTYETHTEPYGVIIQDQYQDSIVCDKNAREIRQWEKDNSSVVHTGIVTVTTTVTCK